MSASVLYISVTVGAVLFALISIVLMIRILRVARGTVRPILILLRVCMLLLLAVLIHMSLFGSRETEESKEEDDRKLVVLHDRSFSMELPADERKTRAELAANVVENLEREAGRRSIQVTPLLFGRNVVSPDDEDRLQPGETRLESAVGQAISRFRMSELLIVSDGGSSESLPPDYLAQLAHRGQVSLNAICPIPDGVRGSDVVLRELTYERRNPREITAIVEAFGDKTPEQRVFLRIKGQPAQEISRKMEGRQEIAFRLPELEPGWHEFSVECEGMSDELSELNNRALGVFEVVRGKRLLAVIGAPRMENRH
ncbi:MAG: hypothetical protein AAF492_26530, partial [Verrucomicrobiota bacterium]